MPNSHLPEDAEPYLPENSLSFYALQMLQGDRRSVAEYQGDSHIPYCITSKLTREQCAPFLDRVDADCLPTFTVRVPLAVVVQGEESIVEHIEDTAFDFPVQLGSREYRPVGATIGSFDEPFSGDVLLQVTCALWRKS